ncbi:MAG: hypothetical protein AAB877_03475, partial [Patescibacteria group bacterium]
MELRIFGILVGLIVANGTIGQGVPAKKTDEWPCAAAYFRDGSLLKVKLLEKDFKVVTEFGELKIPFSKASRIDFGWHYPEGMEKKVSDSIKAPHFVLYVKELLGEKYGSEVVEKGGLIVKTSLDSNIQEFAESAVATEVAKLRNAHVTNGAALVTNPAT